MGTITSYYVGDRPTAALVVVPTRGGDELPLAGLTTATAELYDFDGVPVPHQLVATVLSQEDGVSVAWQGLDLFDQGGLYTLVLTLEGDSGRMRATPERFVVQHDDGWHTIDTARDEWADAPSDDVKLFKLLWNARNEVEAYAPTLAADRRPPINYTEGQLLHARNIWNASKVDPASGGMGDDSFIIRPFPLDWAIKQRLRPQTILGAFGGGA